MAEKTDFLDIIDIIYFTPENAKFCVSPNGFVMLEAFLPPIQSDDLEEAITDVTPKWQDLGRIFFHRAFPFENSDLFISVQNKEQKEYGMIRSLSVFPDDVKELIENELRRKYFMPEITKINSLKERFGFSYWETETNYGTKSFVLQDTFRNIAKVKEGRFVITDVDGNRYHIADIYALDTASFRKIELYL